MHTLSPGQRTDRKGVRRKETQGEWLLTSLVQGASYTLRHGELTPCNGTIWHPNWKVQVQRIRDICQILGCIKVERFGDYSVWFQALFWFPGCF